MASIVINAGGVTGNDSAQISPPPPSDFPRWQENTANRWHIKAICYLVIAPTAIATAATAFFDASMGAALGSSVSDKALLAGLALVPSLYAAGLPIVRELVRIEDPNAADHTGILWMGCAALTIVGAVAYMANGPIAELTPATASQTALQRLESVKAQIAQFGDVGTPHDAGMALQAFEDAHPVLMKRTHWCDWAHAEDEAIGCGERFELASRLEAAQIVRDLRKRAGTLSEEISAKPAGDTAADVGRVGLRGILALLAALGSCLGARPAAAAIRVLMSGKTRNEPEAIPEPDETPADDQESMFRHWARSKLTIGQGGEITSKEAHENYAFYAGCNRAIPLAPTPFGKRLKDYVEARGGSTRKSGSTVYSNVKFFERPPELMAAE